MKAGARMIAAALGICAACAAGAAALPDDAVVAKVGGREITKQDCSNHVRLMEALYKNRHFRASKEKLASASARIRLSAADEILSRAMLHAALCPFGMAIDESERRKTEAKYLAAFGRRGQTFEELSAEMEGAGLGDLFKRNLRMDAEIECALNAAHSNELAVTEEDLETAKRRTREYNERADATNRLFKARLDEALTRLKAGEDFGKLAKEYSMASEDGEGGDFGEHVLSDFDSEDDEYKLAIAQLREGDTTDILDGETGYDIYKATKVIRKEDAATGQTTWRLARIHFEKPYFFDELPDGKLREELAREKRAEVLKRISREMGGRVGVEFPHGRGAMGAR